MTLINYKKLNLKLDTARKEVLIFGIYLYERIYLILLSNSCYLLSREELCIYINWKLIGFTQLIVKNCCCVYLFVVVDDRVDGCGEIQVTTF